MMRRINLKKVMTLWILTAVLTTLHVSVQATTSRERDRSAVRALFDLATPTGGPFPSDRFTIRDRSHNTRLRVNLPKPDCGERPSDCEDIDVINTLDGFNLQPRLSIPFSDPIDVATVTSETIFLLRLGDTLNQHDRDFRRVGINQIVWDSETNTLHVESDELLDQHTRYALIVTSGVGDQSGAAVGASEAFRRFRHELGFGRTRDRDLKRYRKALLDAVKAARAAGVRENEIVSASVFTTQSATSVLEKIRDQIKAATPAPADFLLGPGGSRTVFPLDGVTSITWNQQTGDNPPRFTAAQVNLSALRMIPGAVGQVAFGKYLSPDYRVHPGEYIPPTGTRTGTPQVQGMAEIYFNLFLPSGPKPAAGCPVAIFMHGTGQSKNVNLTLASTMANHGIATIAINGTGHSFGSLGTLTVNRTGGGSVTLPDGGRGIDQNRDGQIHTTEGSEAAPPRTLQLNRDGYLQSLGDLIQLVRVIKVGVDADGDGNSDLDPSRIYYVGLSMGGMLGTDLVAVEPSIRAAVLSVPGAPLIENRRLSPGYRSSGSSIASSSPANLFAARRPSLINSPGITRIAGIPIPPGPTFNENMPLRDGVPMAVHLADGTSGEIRSPVTNTIAGAMEIQQWFDRAAWAAQAANPVAYAPHLRRNPLSGMCARPVIFQFALGDQASPNPNNTTILRAGNLADRATFYRHDLAFAENPLLPKNPHGFMVNIASGTPLAIAIGRGAQEQIAVFFASDGTVIIHPEPARFFEVPISSPLPEDLNYIP